MEILELLRSKLFIDIKILLQPLSWRPCGMQGVGARELLRHSVVGKRRCTV